MKGFHDIRRNGVLVSPIKTKNRLKTPVQVQALEEVYNGFSMVLSQKNERLAIDGIDIVIDPTVFHESLLAGGIAKLLLGDVLKEGTPLSINPLVLWAWTGLIINAINSIPTGELDGKQYSYMDWTCISTNVLIK